MVTIDRRRRKSQEAIMNAFIKLLSEKDLQNITMNEIADKADVSRGTIYSNFLDKHDLLEKCVQINMEHFFSYCVGEANEQKELSREVLLESFDYLEENRELFKILLNENSNIHFEKYLLNHSVELLKEEHLAQNGTSLIADEIKIQFYSSALNGIITWWLLNDEPCSPKEVTSSLWTLLQDFNQK